MHVYEAVGDVSKADSVVGLSFSTSIEEGSVNDALQQKMLYHADGRPMIADRTLVNAMPNGDERMAHVVEGPVTHLTRRGFEGVGTWGTLVEAQQYMEENDLNNPILIAQAYHIRRVVKQAAKLGMSYTVPEGLPAHFDKDSDQLWTSSPYYWIPMNALGSVLLRIRGQL